MWVVQSCRQQFWSTCNFLSLSLSAEPPAALVCQKIFIFGDKTLHRYISATFLEVLSFEIKEVARYIKIKKSNMYNCNDFNMRDCFSSNCLKKVESIVRFNIVSFQDTEDTENNRIAKHEIVSCSKPNTREFYSQFCIETAWIIVFIYCQVCTFRELLADTKGVLRAYIILW